MTNGAGLFKLHRGWLAILLIVTACSSSTQGRQVDGPSHPQRGLLACVVSRISDGDSFECTSAGRVRLIGIDAPELSQDPWGRQAADALRALMPPGSTVSLELDIEEQDQFGRTLAHVWVDSTLVNWQMMKAGWTVLLTYPPNVRYVDWLTAAQEQARTEGVGLWVTGGFDCLPIDRRRARC